MKPGNRRGFVLLEAVVALAILGVASIVLLQVRAQQIRVAAQAHELLTAQALAEDRISAIRMLDYQLLADPPDSMTAGVFPPPFQDFSWTAQIALMEDEYDLFGVEVEVLGPAERFPLRTLMHRARPVLATGGGAGGGGAAGGMMGGGMGMRGDNPARGRGEGAEARGGGAGGMTGTTGVVRRPGGGGTGGGG